MHPEGPATGQHDQSVPWPSSVQEQRLNQNPKSTWHCTLLTQPCQCYQHFATMLQSAQMPSAAYCQQSTSQPLSLRPTFRRRTSGHSLGNFIEVNLLFVPHSPDSLSLSRSSKRPALHQRTVTAQRAARRHLMLLIVTPSAITHTARAVFIQLKPRPCATITPATQQKTQADFKLPFLFLFVFPPSARRPTQRNWPPS